MKLALLRTPLGSLAQTAREHLSLLFAASRSLEAVGTIANDVMARRLLERLCIEGGTFVDVGAHIGSVISGALRHSHPAQVIAIEAIPEKAARLRKAFPLASIFQCALGDREGETSFFIADEQSGYSSLDPGLAERQGKTREIKVPIHRLDTLIEPEGIDVIKIDVEGAELGVLRGAPEILKAARPTIMFESGLTEMADYPRAEMWQFLDANDYDVVLPCRLAHEGPGIDEQGFLEAHIYPPRSTNYFGVARSRRAEVRERARKILGIK